MVLKESFYSNTTCFNVPSLAHSSLLYLIKKKKKKKLFPPHHLPCYLFYFLNFEATVFQSSSASSLVLEKNHENSVSSSCLLYIFSLLSMLFLIHPQTLLLCWRWAWSTELLASQVYLKILSKLNNPHALNPQIWNLLAWISYCAMIFFLSLVSSLTLPDSFVFHSGWRNSESSETI